MNSNLKLLPAALLVAVLALAGCGGGGSGDTAMTDEDMKMQEAAVMSAKTDVDAAAAAAAALTVDSDRDAVDAAQALIDASTAALAKVVADGYLTADEAAPYEAKLRKAQMLVSEQNGRLAQQADDAEEAMKKAKAEAAMRMNALAKALKAGIATNILAGQVDDGVNTEGRPYFDSEGDLVLHPWEGGVTGNALPSTVADARIDLKPDTATVRALGNWAGARYVRTDDDGEVTDTAVIYTNQGPPKRELFATKHAGIINPTGEVPNASLNGLMPMASEFRTTPGVKDHQLPASVTTRPDYISIGGTLDGAPGQFRCGTTAGTDVCTSTGTQAGGTTLSAGWYFIADANAMTSTPDTAYSGFGWWLNEDGDDKWADGFWFVTRAGAAAAISDNNGSTSITAQTDLDAVQALKGTATYNGHAAGKVGFYDPVLNSRNVGGHFTADATLNVDFQDQTTPAGGTESWGTLTGTIDDFVVNDQAMDGWEVKLLTEQSGGSPVESNISGPSDGGVLFSGRTSWSIDGETANADTGRFEGTLLDKHEDSNVPLTAVGDFTARYGAVGSMTGGFGATTTDPDD